MENPFAEALRLRTRLHLSRLASEMRRAALDAITVAVAALMALAATGCGVAALWLFLQPRIGAPGAALSAAAALLALGGAIIWVRRVIAQRGAQQAQLPPASKPDLADAASQCFSANKMALLLAALAAGATAADALRGK